MTDGTPSPEIKTPPIGRAMVMRSGLDTLTVLKRGADAVADAVKFTLGPVSCGVLIENRGAAPILARDGAAVARSITLDDRFEDMGGQFMREGILSAVQTARDGAGATAVIAQGIIEQGVLQIAAGANAMLLARGIVEATRVAIGEIDRQARGAPESDMLERVATTCGGDAGLGAEVAAMVARLGDESEIEIRPGPVAGIRSYYSFGMQLNRGWYSPRLATNATGDEAVLAEAVVFVTSGVIHGAELMAEIIANLAARERPFLIVADHIDEAALQVLVVNKLSGVIEALAIQAPGFGDNKLEILEDLALFTGGKVVHDLPLLLGAMIDDLPEHLGSATRILTRRRSSVITGGGGDPERVRRRIAEIRDRIAPARDDVERRILRGRLSHLDSGAGVIEFGAATEVERRELRRKLDATVEVTRAALRGGVVPGGGTTYLAASKVVERTKWTENDKAGALCVQRALLRPLEQIARNAGFSGSMVVAKTGSMDAGYGFDVRSGKYVDMAAAGIVDAAPVATTALRAAASLAGSLLTTDVAIHYAPSVWWPPPPERPRSD